MPQSGQRPSSSSGRRPETPSQQIQQDPDRPGSSRTPRPSGVKMPTPPIYTRTPSASGTQRDRSGGSPGPGQTQGTSTHELGGQSPTMSPSTSNTGPLSPGAQSSGNAFVFPLRSVFQNKSHSSQGQGQGDDAGGRGYGASGSRPPSEGRPSPLHERRFSQSLLKDDAGIATIQQLLEQGTNEPRERKRPSGQPGVATFTGKIDRSASGTNQDLPKPQKPASAGIPEGNRPDEPHDGFFSMPNLADREPTRSPFFGETSRRQSIASGHISRQTSRQEQASRSTQPQQQQQPQHQSQESHPSQRPEPLERISDQTVTPENTRPDPENPSADAPGSGLTDPARPPVGQPTHEPEGINFSHRPGGDNLEASTSFKSQGMRDTPETSASTATAKPADTKKEAEQGQKEHTETAQEQRETTQAGIRHPKPHSVGHGPMPGLGGSDTSGSYRGTSTHLELDEQGEQTLIHDFAGIVRLGEPGSLSSAVGTGGAGTGTGTGSGVGSKSRASGTGTGSAQSGAAVPGQALARAQRRNARDHTRDSVRNFVESQARTVNLADPNAPTPSTTPHGDSDEAEAESEAVAAASTVEVPNTPPPRAPMEELPAESSSAPAQDRENKEWTESSEASMSVRDSSEMATASGEDRAATGNESDEEEPIVTFRFEHSQNEDGHHVVVGREGKLRTCEDEPITTPGAVQGFGVLIVLEEDYDTGDLVVRQVSENATELLGLSPKYLFRLSCFTRILTTDQEDLLRDNLEYLPDPQDPETGGQGVAEEGPQVFLLSGYGEPGSDEQVEEDDTSDVAGRRREWTCWVAAHRPAQPNWNKTDSMGEPIDPPDIIILEFELERDPYNPLMQPFESQTFSSTSGFGSRSGGATPDSGSQTTASAGSRGSMPDRSTSFGSGEDSTGSVTTVGTTPRPGMSPSSSGTAVGNNKALSSGATYSGSRASARPEHQKPQGLDGLEMEMPLDRIIESTTNHAKPLRALERMRRTGLHSEGGSTEHGSGSGSTSRRGGRARRPPRRAQGGSTGTMDVFAVLGQINEQLGSAPDLETFLKITVGVVQDLCRFHRVLIYQFDESYNGQVVAELVEWGKTTDLFKGLMFPAADIPAQARQLYAINKVRLLYDRSQTTARMVLKNKDDLDHPLDMTHCYLRAMSPIHIKYLQNMHVRSSMSVSIMAFGQLWGLIACHSYGHHGMRVSFPVRQMMRLLSDSISKNIERLSYAQRLHTRKLISTIPTQHHPTGYIVSNADDLLQIFDAESGLLVIGDGCKLLGNNEQGQAMLSIAEYLRVMRFDTMRSSSHIKKDFPDLNLPRAEDTIAGLLFVPLTVKAGQDFIVFLRKGQSREVQWAGKPYKDEQTGEAASLEPRKSFKTWSETVTGRSRAWTDDQLESAGVLALIYGKFIQVWREKQSAMASNQLTAILLSNTSHAVRTPLSQIINTLELALSGDIDADTRSMLENSHQASRALLFHVHDLLDLTRIETGNETAFNDPFDLRQAVHDAVRLYQNESKRRGLDFRVVIADDLPSSVIGDSRKIKTVISNLVANSVKFTEQGFIEVTVRQYAAPDDQDIVKPNHVAIEIIIADSGCGIPTDKLERMFVTLEGAEEIRDDQQVQSPTGLGLGLAVVARIVEQLGGQLRAESEVDVGSKFFFTSQMLEHTGGTIATMGTGTGTRSKASSAHSGSVVSKARTKSSGSGSALSMRSGHSGTVSEIDSFVHDFGASHMLSAAGPDDRRLKEAEERMSRPGTFPVTDSSYPVRPSKMESDIDSNTSGQSPSSPPPRSPQPPTRPQLGAPRHTHHGGHPHYGQSTITAPPANPQRSASLRDSHASGSGSGSGSQDRRTSADQGSSHSPHHKPQLRVLVVEDDAINSQILQKRLKMDKHQIKAVTNGQEAVDCLRDDWGFDAVLMDIQMPIMDGRTAAREIRKLESKPDHPDQSDALRVDNRIPIFAVSASLYESDRDNLSADFDGWLLKPLDFSRVRILLNGLQDPAKRDAEVYVQGQWERGGYFHGSPNDA